MAYLHRFLSIGSPLANSIRKAACLSSSGESLRTLTERETAFLNACAPNELKEALAHPYGFRVMATVWESPAMSDDLIVRITFSLLESGRPLTKLTRFWQCSICHLLRLRDMGLCKCPVDRQTGEIAYEGALLFRASTLPATMRPGVMPNPALLFDGLRASLSSGQNEASAATNRCGGQTLA